MLELLDKKELDEASSIDEPLKHHYDVLFNEGWIKFNEIKWKLTHKKVNINGHEIEHPSLHSILFLNNNNRIVRPPMNPYLPLWFKTTPTNSKVRQQAQWLSACKALINEFHIHDFKNTIFLPPMVTDIRPWQWAGLRASVRYTYVIDFPYHLGQAESEVRRKINKAQKNGYLCERTTNMQHVYECLVSTELRQGFKHHLTLDDLILAQELVGEEHLRAYVAYAPNGEPVSAEVILHSPYNYGYGWVCGNKKEHLKNGTNQYLMYYAMEDLNVNGSMGLDLCGANMPNVSQNKMGWGVDIKPYYTIDNYSIKTVTKWSRDWFRYSRLKWEV
ncbi:GNAT family N-acetyltransferase [Paenibacillus albiflavus]|nr:GNAT family N-acetyltransferase [Paenibacillus albiflavus]